MEPEEYLRGRTLYEYEQVITRDNLVDFLEHLLIEYQHVSPIFFRERVALEAAVKTVDTLITWLDNKKPRNYEGMI